MKALRSIREDGTPAGGAPGMSTPNANVTGDTPNMAMPPSMVPGPVLRRKYKQFDLETETFRKFEKGRMKFERWSKFLNMENENHRSLYDYANKNSGKDHLIVIRDSSTGAMRAIRRRPHNGE